MRKWKQFRLRTLLILVTLLSVLLGLLGREYRRARIQEACARKLQATGGSVSCESSLWWFSAYSPKGDGTARRALRSVFGDYFFGIVKNVTFQGKVSSQELDVLDDMPSVDTVTFIDCNISAPLLRTLGRQKGITGLQFARCKFSEDAYEELQNMSHLKRLEFAPNNLEPVPLKFSSGLPNLEALAILYSNTDASELEHVNNPAALKSLQLGYTSGNKVFDHLVRFQNLEELLLNSITLDSEDFSKILKLQNLARISFQHIVLEEDTFNTICQMQQLEILLLDTITESSITDKQRIRLKQSLPKVRNFR